MDKTKWTVRIKGRAAAKLARLAEHSGRSEEWFANFIIAEYAERELGIVRDLKAAIKSADEGNLVPHEEVMAQARATIEKARAGRGGTTQTLREVRESIMTETKRTVTIEGEAAVRLAELAELSGRSEEWFANFMITEYADRELGIVRDLKAAMKSADEGNLVPHEEAKARIRAAIERARQTAAE